MTFPKPKIVFIGNVKMSTSFLDVILNDSRVEVTGIVTKTTSTFNADHVCLSTGLPSHIPFFHFEGDSLAMEKWVRDQRPDVIFCFGWSHILPASLHSFPKHGAIAFHPAELPKHRGRHPLIWTLVLGLEQSASTFFKMGDGADDGDIISQEKFAIHPNLNAQDLYSKVTEIGKKQISFILNQLVEGSLQSKPQDHSESSYWRKRSAKDGLIDWRMSATSIDRLIRALSHPYSGAEMKFNDSVHRVWKSEVTVNTVPTGREPGYVIAKDSESFSIVCGEGILRLLDVEPPLNLSVGDYL